MGSNSHCHCHGHGHGHPAPPTSTTCHCTMCYTTTHYPPPPHHYYPPQIHQYPPPLQTHHQQQQQQQNALNTTVSSLIHRISALESSLRLRRRKHSPSLRDAAARTIQTHFRAYLVRRSVTLRHLKHLAHIKSALNRLKSSVSSKPHFDPHTISRESMSLLIKLDSIQGSDPMIRDGKRSISRELIQFMELIDEMRSRVKQVNFKKKCMNLNQVDVQNGGVLGKTQPKVKKNVSFDENGNVYRLFKTRVNSSREDDEVEEIGVSLKDTEAEEEDDDSSEMSGNEMDPRKNLRTRVDNRIKKNQPDQEEEDESDDDDDDDNSFVFSAPLPAKMEY